MDRYRMYDVHVRVDDVNKPAAILNKHMRHGNIDYYEISYMFKESNGLNAIGYRIAPIIYEDLEIIKNDLKEAGIQIL